MTAVDNSELIAGFMPEVDDGDTFLYTELLDRSKRTAGSNRVRVLRTFYHRSRDDFWRRWPVIKELCDQTGVRAYTRLSPRSYAKVGKLFAARVIEHALAGNFNGLAYAYASACGCVTPNKKLWLLDVDDLASWADFHNDDAFPLTQVAAIPSRKGLHVVVTPFDTKTFMPRLPAGVSVHKDNPTNLYIPASAQ
jgi:hypothetical protein